jgi:hypothetical protein
VSPRDFLKLLWLEKLASLVLLVWTLRGKRSYWFRDLEAAAQFIESVHGQDVYMGYGLSPEDYGPSHRCPSENIISIAGAWADLDLHSDAHKTKPLPRTIEEALTIIPSDLPPSLVLRTGNGVHVWWLFREPEVFSTSDERDRTVRVLNRLHTLLRLRAGRRGWSYDRLSDLARLVRIPGTVNAKDPADPKNVEVYSQSDRRYNVSDLEDYLNDAGVPGEDETGVTGISSPDPQDLTINLDAAIPQDVLDGWMAADLRFRETWLRQRRDLKDRSQSGYDLALANFGVDADLKPQQIVDLIVHHRRIHAQKARTKIEYYLRTISAAMDREGAVSPANVTTDTSSQLPGSEKDGQDQGGGADREIQKALLCDRVSKALGVQIVGFVKITGQEPSYHMNLHDGTVIEFSTFAKFTNQEHVRNAIGAMTNRLVPKVKPKVWEGIAQAMLDSLVEKAGGDDTDMLGSTRIHLRRYLSSVGFIDSVDDQPVHEQRLPAVLDGNITISATDFQMYITKTAGQNLTVKAITSRLAALGAESVRPRSGVFRDQSRWALPVGAFKPEDYQDREGSSAR